MKKAISMVLAICVLFASISTVITSSVLATTDYYDNAENWKLYSQNDTIGGTPSAVTTYSITDFTDISYPNSNGSSLRVHSQGTVPSIALQGLEVGKKYNLSFCYYAPTFTKASSVEAWMDMVGVYKNGSATVSSNGKITCSSAVAGGTTTKVGKVANGTFGDATWHSYTMSFEVTAETGTDLHFAYRSWYADGCILYLDEFKVTEVLVDYYADADNWKIYSSGDTIGGTASAPSNGHAVTELTTISYPDNTGSSLRVFSHGDVPSIALQDLEVGKIYNLSFCYYIPSDTKVSGLNAWMNMVGIYKNGSATVGDSGKITCDSAVAGGTTTKVGEVETGVSGDAIWYSHIMTFAVTAETGTDLHFAYRAWYGGGYVIYLDEFKVTEVDYDSDLENPAHWGEVSSVYTVGDTITATSLYSVSTDISGTPSNHSVLYNSTWGKMMATKLQGLKENTSYILSFKHKVAEANKVNDAATYYKLFGGGLYTKGTATAYQNNNIGGITITGTSLTSGGNLAYNFDVWNDYELSFTTGTDTEVYFLAFLYADKLYFDDVKLVEKVGVTTMYNSTAALRTSTNSSTGKNGLRIYNEIETEWLQTADIVEYGSIAVREGYLDKLYDSKCISSKDITLENLLQENGIYNGQGIGIGVSYRKEGATTKTGNGATNKIWAQTDTTIDFTSYLTGIDSKYYGDSYLICTYAIAENGTVYYGDTFALCVYDVAYSIDCGSSADGNEPTDIDIDAFNEFADIDNDYVAYKEWLATKNLDPGKLSGQ